MASRRRRPGDPSPGEGPRNPLTNSDPLNNPRVPLEREEGGLGSLYRIAEGPEGPESPRRSPRDREPGEFEEPTSSRRKPGLGEKGLSRIRQELGGLPNPEEIQPIVQSTKGGFSTPRPDRHVEFWKAAESTQSTRVAAAQWIPTEITKAGVVGDLFIAFARPHKGKSTLFLYKDKSEKLWQEFKGTDSFGKFIKRLGEYSEHSESDYSFYRKLHPDHGWWIFTKPWTTIRANNESIVGGPKAPRGVVKRVAASAMEEAERILKDKYDK